MEHDIPSQKESFKLTEFFMELWLQILQVKLGLLMKPIHCSLWFNLIPINYLTCNLSNPWYLSHQNQPQDSQMPVISQSINSQKTEPIVPKSIKAPAHILKKSSSVTKFTGKFLILFTDGPCRLLIFFSTVIPQKEPITTGFDKKILTKPK